MSDDPRWGDDPRDRRDDDWRELERNRDSRDREEGLDPRDVFMRDLDLPRGPHREIVHDARERHYTLRGSETRTLSTVGAFRVVSARDLRDHDDRPADPRSGDLRHLWEEGLIRTERLDGRREHVVVLTDRGRDVLNANRDDRHQDHRQEFYAGLVKPREVEHDSQIYRAYLREAERLAERDARVDRVVLDYELKSEYQRWLHERDGDREDCSGRPDREAHEIEEWARDHELPYFDDQVHFPDLRIEYEELDGRRDHEDVEVVTIHYRGAHGAAAARSGFSCYSGSSSRISGGGGGRGGRGSAHPRLAEEFLD
jgi:DNA-binding PadR family transcriptional regulator